MKSKIVAPMMSAIVLTGSIVAIATQISPTVAISPTPVASGIPQTTESGAPKPTQSGAPKPTESGAPKPTESGAPSTKPLVIKAGSFVAAEAPTKGTARILGNNGKYTLELSQAFSTKAGPDLVVVLHKAPNVLAVTKPPTYSLKEGDYVRLAPLKKTSGVQRYSIPKTVKISDYNSVAIWCRKFNATFGAASLAK